MTLGCVCMYVLVSTVCPMIAILAGRHVLRRCRGSGVTIIDRQHPPSSNRSPRFKSATSTTSNNSGKTSACGGSSSAAGSHASVATVATLCSGSASSHSCSSRGSDDSSNGHDGNKCRNIAAEAIPAAQNRRIDHKYSVGNAGALGTIVTRGSECNAA